MDSSKWKDTQNPVNYYNSATRFNQRKRIHHNYHPETKERDLSESKAHSLQGIGISNPYSVTCKSYCRIPADSRLAKRNKEKGQEPASQLGSINKPGSVHNIEGSNSGANCGNGNSNRSICWTTGFYTQRWETNQNTLKAMLVYSRARSPELSTWN